MSKYSMGSNNEYNDDQVNEDSTEQSADSSTTSENREWKPTVRLQKRDSAAISKIRILDLYPDKHYIKEVNDGEVRYFLLLMIPVVVSAFFTAIQRDDLYNKFIDIIVKFFTGN